MSSTYQTYNITTMINNLCNIEKYLHQQLRLLIKSMNILLSKILGDENEYLSLNSVDMSDANESEAFSILTSEFLNSLVAYGLLNQNIKLKVGTPVTLLRNLDQSQGLCNGTMLVVTKIPLFSHGQLFITILRVQNKNGLKILIHDKDDKLLKTTTNIIYNKVFQNLQEIFYNFFNITYSTSSHSSTSRHQLSNT
ncbi:hypothetical protein Lal_00018603 [Lupinus albus]|nr:hypothetical protein Lal_00018603 [Lupinus albus]